MLPDKGAFVTIIGRQQLEDLSIPMGNLQPPPPTIIRMADGSEMSPTLGTIRVTFMLGDKSCKVTFLVLTTTRHHYSPTHIAES